MLDEREDLQGTDDSGHDNGADDAKKSGSGTDTQDANEEKFDQDQAVAKIRQYRNEAAEQRRRAENLEADLKKNQRQAELDKMEESERLKAQAEDAKARLAKMEGIAINAARRSMLVSVASTAGFRSPEDAVSLVSLKDLPVDDDGNVDRTIAEQMIGNLKENKPYLLNDGSADDKHETKFGANNPDSGNYPRVRLTNQAQIAELQRKAMELTNKGDVKSAIGYFNEAHEMSRKLKGG